MSMFRIFQTPEISQTVRIYFGKSAWKESKLTMLDDYDAIDADADADDRQNRTREHQCD